MLNDEQQNKEKGSRLFLKTVISYKLVIYYFIVNFRIINVKASATCAEEL